MLARILAAVALLMLQAVTATAAEEADKLSRYLEAAKDEYQRALLALPPEKQRIWKDLDSRQLDERATHAQDREREVAWLDANPQFEEIKGVYAYEYLADHGELELKHATELAEGAGHDSLEVFVETNVEPLMTELRGRLEKLRGRSSDETLRKDAKDFFSIEQDLNELLTRPPVRDSIDYRPKRNAYDDSPDLVGTFTLHGWQEARETADGIARALEKVETSVRSEEFLSVRDPLALIPLSVQFAILLVAVAGYLINYTQKPSVIVVTSLVGMSVAVSLVLVIISRNTFLNLALQSLVPAGFILYWALWKGRAKKVRSP